MRDYLTSQQAADSLGLTRRRIRQLCESGQIAGAVKLGRDWMIPPKFKVCPPPKKAKP